MLGGDGADTPTRYELLSMVKKHSNLLGKTTVDEEDASDIEMDSDFWHNVLDLYFVRSRESRGRQDDDLIFFVRRKNLHGYGFNDHLEGNSPYFVRRWAAKQLDKIVSKNLMEVDWRRSFYLNLIAHTSFSVTVAICSQQVIRNHQSGQDSLSPIYKVVKTVYASPSRINFHLDSKKEVETTPAYPDICFAVDDFDSTFDAVVLTDTDHCYCILLNAHAGAGFPNEKEKVEGCSSDATSKIDTGSDKTNIFKLTLFSGFVSYQMVRDAYDAGKSGFGSLLSFRHTSDKADRLYMRGPGGCGEVEVAVSGVADQSQLESGPFSPVYTSKRGFGIGTFIHKAAYVASEAAKHVYAAASSSRSSDDEMLPLKCCLMSVSLPWEHIAYDLLFKGSPPVNM